MEAVTIVTGTRRAPRPLRRRHRPDHPRDWLKRVERTGFGDGPVLRVARRPRLRAQRRAQFAGATILVAGPNFGTGSSPEHAVWAIMDYGFQAVISPRFADIFRNNCTKNGLVPVHGRRPRSASSCCAAVEADPTLEITVDVERRTVEAPAIGIEVDVPARRLHPAPLPRGPRRHRHHAAPRGRHHRLRGHPPGLDALHHQGPDPPHHQSLAHLAPPWGRHVSH